MYSITLSNGNSLDNLNVNGSMFISNSPVDPNTFTGGLREVTISCDGEDTNNLTGTFAHMQLAVCEPHGTGSWFALYETPAEQLERLKDRADIEYLAMMSGVDL